MPPPSDIVKVAIEWPGANAQLLEIDQVSSQNEKQWYKERGLGSVWQRVSSGLGTTDISKGKLSPVPSCGRLVTEAWERPPLPQKVSRKKSTRRPQVHPAWPPSRQSLGTNRMWSKGHSLSFRNGPWHPSSRKFVMGGHCRIQSITPCVMQTGPSSTSRNRSVKGEASQHRPFCEVNHPGRPRCLPNLRPGSIHYLGEELLPGQMREPGLVLLSGLEHRGFHFLRAQGAGRES